MRANEEGPDAAPGPGHPDRHPASRDPGGAGLRHRPRARAGTPRRGGTRRAAPHRPQPGPHDRSGHQHVSGRRHWSRLAPGRSSSTPARPTRPTPPPSWPPPLGWGRSAPLWSPTPTSTTRPGPPRWPTPPAPGSSATAPPRGSTPTSGSGRGGVLVLPGWERCAWPDAAGPAHTRARLGPSVLAGRGARPPA